MSVENSSFTTHTEAWMVPLDILSILCLFSVIALAFLFLSILIFDKTCHTVPMLLVPNSCLVELLVTGNVFWTSIFGLINDLKQQQYQDRFCIFRAHFGYATCFTQNYSYLLQAIYRYITVVHPSRLFYQSARFQLFLISLTWILGFTCALPHLFTGEIKYLVDDQLCQMPAHLSIVSVYNVIYIYLLPLNGIILIYFKLIRYVKEMRTHITPANTLLHAQRGLRMVQQIVLLISILLVFGLPYAAFVFMGFFTHPPKFHFRIAYVVISVSLIFIMITLFKFTDPVKTSLTKMIRRRPNVVVATQT